MRIAVRRWREADRQALERAGVHPLLARLYAARAVRSAEELHTGAAHLHPPSALKGCAQAASLLADAIEAGRRILVVADFDADGATACAVALRALRSLGAEVDWLVPNRFETGHGLSPEVVALAMARRPHVLLTVDNGIASVEGVERARTLGLVTVITDHHLPGAELPEADAIVNPNQAGCPFPSKALCGAGVVFYVMLALRAELRRRGRFARRPEPNLAALTDLVALGTVADVVPLDANNRRLVALGLARLRRGATWPGLRALCAVAGRSLAQASCRDLGYALGPRLNAAGRLADMTLGVECLVTDDPARAAACAAELDRLNGERGRIEQDMLETVRAKLARLADDGAVTACLYEPSWHPGVIGIVAARVRERLHRPAICFAPAGDGPDGPLLRGSGRSVPALNLRDCLDLVAKREPGLIERFGGHAQAAGLTLAARAFERFAAAFERAAAEMLPEEARGRVVVTDGELETAYHSLEVAALLEAQIWGAGFAPPVFAGEFEVHRQRAVGARHLKLELVRDGVRYAAMRYRSLEALPPRIRAAYRLALDEYQGLKSLTLALEHVVP